MKRKLNVSAVLAAACAAAVPSVVSAQTWSSWGDLGSGGISMLNAANRSPRQFGLTVTPTGVFGAWNSGDPLFGDGDSSVFKSTAPGLGNMTVQALPTGYSAVDKMIYNPFDGNLYLRSNTVADWGSGAPASNPAQYPTGMKAGLFKMDQNLVATELFTPVDDRSVNHTYLSGMTLDYDNGNMIFSVNNSVSGGRHDNIYYYNPNTNTTTNLIQGNTGQNTTQLNEGVVYLGNGRIAELDAGNGATIMNITRYTNAGGATEAANVADEFYYFTGGTGAGNDGAGGVTAALFDPGSQSLHVLERMRISGANDRLINTTFYPAVGQSQLGTTAAARNSVWHAKIPGATYVSDAAGDTNSNGGGPLQGSNNVVAVNSAVLTPDGQSVILGFAGDAPYGVADGETHLWMKNLVTPDGTAARVATNDQNNWVDLGVIDPGGGQVVSVATGNIGAGQFGSGRNSYDIWAITQDRSTGQLKLNATTNEIVSRIEWDINGTTAGAGGATPSGDWDGVATNFNTNIAGGNGTLTAVTTDRVVGFAAGNDATGAYTVNVVGTQAARRVDIGMGNVTLGGAGTLDVRQYDVQPGASGTITADVAGNYDKRGAGTLVMSGTKTNAGTTTVSAGTLQFAQPAALYNNTPASWTASNITVKTGSTLALNVGGVGEFGSSDINTLSALGTGSGGFQNFSSLGLDTTNAAGGTFTHAGTLADTNAGANRLGIRKLGSGELVLSGSNTYSGGTTIGSGTLTGVNGNSLGATNSALTVNSTTGTGNATVVNLSTTGGTTLGSLSGAVSGAGNTATINNGGQLFTVNQDADGTYQGTIAGAGGFTKAGAATLTLPSANTYAGTTTVSAGTLRATNLADEGNASSIGTGPLTLNGGTLDYTGGAVSLARVATVTSAGGTLASSGSGPITLTNPAGVVFSTPGANSFTVGGSNTGANTLPALIANNGGATKLVKTGAGNWDVTNNANSYTGSTEINGGTLTVGTIANVGVNSAIGAGSGAANDIVLNNGALKYTGAAASTNRQISAGPGVISPAGGIGANNNANLGNGAMSTIDSSGTGPVTFSGALNNTTTGGFRKINLTGSNTGNNTAAFNITDGSINSGAGVAVDKNGAGTWVLSGNNTYMGRTTVNGGKLVLQGAKPMGDWSILGHNDASGAGFSNQLFVNNAGSTVELSTTHPTHLETIGGQANTSLVLGGQDLNIYNGASGNGGTNTFSGVISGTGNIYVGPQNNLGTTAYPGGIPQSVLSRTLTFNGANTFTGDTHIQGGNFTISNVAGTAPRLGGPNGALEISNLRSTVNGGNVVFTLGINNLTAQTVVLDIGSLSGSIVPPVNAGSGGLNDVIVNLQGGGQRHLNIKQTANTTFAGKLQGNGGQIFLDAASTGTLLLTGVNTNNGFMTVNGGTLQAKTPASFQSRAVPNVLVANAGGTLAVNVGGPAPVTPAGVPAIGAEWTSADIDTLKSNAALNAGSHLGFDTTNATGGNFSYASAMNGAYGVAKLGTGTLTLPSANTLTGPTAVRAGTLVAANADALPSGALSISTGATAVAQAGLPKALSVASVTTAGTGKLNLTNNDLVVKSTTVAAVQALLLSGFNGGTWDGPGIQSSAAATDPNGFTALGYLSNADLGATEFSGVPVDADDILVKYTYYGDADLSGNVTLDDYSQFLFGFQNPVAASWSVGDFDYSGTVTLDDFSVFLLVFQNQGGPLGGLAEAISADTGLSEGSRAAMLGAIAAVPEPGTLGALALAGIGMLGRRRGRCQA